jgi:hypothetical protein
MARLDKLVGSDASLAKASFAAPLTTGTAVAGAWYKIAIKTGDTVFPAGYVVGDLWQGDGTVTFSATNSGALATFTTVADCSSFDMQFSADEIEVTVLVDGVKKYRKGKTDLSGTVRGINMVSEMKKAGSLLNRFLRVVTGDKLSIADSVMNTVAGDSYYIKAMLQDDDVTTGEDAVFLFGEVELFGYSLGADMGSAQEWESGMRFIGADPIVYVIAN